MFVENEPRRKTADDIEMFRLVAIKQAGSKFHNDDLDLFRIRQDIVFRQILDEVLVRQRNAHVQGLERIYRGIDDSVHQHRASKNYTFHVFPLRPERLKFHRQFHR